MSAAAGSPPGRLSLRRAAALIRKESLQVFRDPSSIIVGIVMPMIAVDRFFFGT